MRPPVLPSAPHPGAPPLQQLMIFICEQDHWQHRPLYLAILELVRAQGGAGASVFKGVAGYSATSRAIRTGNLVDVVPDLPLLILIVDEAERIAALLPPLEKMVAPSGGLLTVVDVAAHRYRHPTLGPGARRPLKVRDIMEPQVTTVTPDTPVADLLPLLLHKFYKALPVVDAERRVLGMVTDGDLLGKTGLGLRISVLEALREQGAAGFEALIQALRTGGATARDVMGVRPAAVIGPDAAVAEAARLMVAHGVKRLPVVDQERRLLGIVGRLDILKAASHVWPGAAGPEGSTPIPTNAQTVGDVMRRDVCTVDDEATLDMVTDLLVGSPGARRVVVTDSPTGRHVVGIITDADLVKRVTEQSRPSLVRILRERLSFLGLNAAEQAQATRLRSGTAREVMTAPVITAPVTLPISAAIQLMIERGVKVLPITDAEGRLVGIVNRAGLLEVLLQHLEQAMPAADSGAPNTQPPA